MALHITIYCDECGDFLNEDGLQGYRTLAEAKGVAREKGWRVTKNCHWCPKCRPRLEMF